MRRARALLKSWVCVGNTPRGRRRDHGKPRFTFHDEQWQAMLNELRAFNEANGHFKVTRNDLKLYNWAHEQRRKEKNGELADYRRERWRASGSS